MTTQPETRTKRRRRPRTAEVLRTEWLTPHMVRVVLGGDGLAGFAAGEFADHYVKLIFPPPGAPYGLPVDPEAVEAEHPRELWPVTRTYTVRSWDEAAVSSPSTSCTTATRASRRRGPPRPGPAT